MPRLEAALFCFFWEGGRRLSGAASGVLGGAPGQKTSPCAAREAGRVDSRAAPATVQATPALNRRGLNQPREALAREAEGRSEFAFTQTKESNSLCAQRASARGARALAEGVSGQRIK